LFAARPVAEDSQQSTHSHVYRVSGSKSDSHRGEEPRVLRSVFPEADGEILSAYSPSCGRLLMYLLHPFSVVWITSTIGLGRRDIGNRIVADQQSNVTRWSRFQSIRGRKVLRGIDMNLATVVFLVCEDLSDIVLQKVSGSEDWLRLRLRDLPQFCVGK
jgi:hypothetical protein